MIIGVTGTLGAGKGTVVEYLENKGFKRFAVSDTFLAGEAVRRGLVPDRVTRRNIANEYRAKSPTALMEEVFKLASSALASGENVVIEPQHTVAEVGFIKTHGGVEIAVDADFNVRFDRIRKRGSSKDQVTFEDFKKHQAFEMKQSDPNKNNLGAAIAHADYIILNNGTVEDLHRSIDEVLHRIGGRG